MEEWAIIELQGDLKHSSGDISNGQIIGDLHYTNGGVPILIIGIHVLHGKELALPKPMAVLLKNQSSPMSIIDDDDVSSTNYIVKAVIKKKLIFKGRPKPIVTDVPIGH